VISREGRESGARRRAGTRPQPVDRARPEVDQWMKWRRRLNFTSSLTWTWSGPLMLVDQAGFLLVTELGNDP
jgi:hypothetical protein